MFLTEVLNCPLQLLLALQSERPGRALHRRPPGRSVVFSCFRQKYEPVTATSGLHICVTPSCTETDRHFIRESAFFFYNSSTKFGSNSRSRA